MFLRLTAAIQRRGSAPPHLPGVFRPRRTAWTLAACLCAIPFVAGAQNPLVFVGADQRLEVSPADVAPVFMHGRPSVQFQLAQDDARDFQDLTGAMIGKTLTVSLCGKPLLQAVVQERLDGIGILNMPTAEAAIAVTDVVDGEADCLALEPHFHD